MADLPYTCICVRGDDAFDFLQNQLAADLRALESEPMLLSAWCNPKGRVICLMRVRKDGDGYVLCLPTELAEPVRKRLEMFRFRAKVEFTERSADLVDLGIDDGIDDWAHGLLVAGIPEVWADQSEGFTAHMLNLDLIGAVSLDKGCYPGQEIIARTHFRGASKRRLQRFESDIPVSGGDKVMSGDRVIGDVVNAIGHDLLAVVPAGTTEAEVNGREIRPREMSYSLA